VIERGMATIRFPFGDIMKCPLGVLTSIPCNGFSGFGRLKIPPAPVTPSSNSSFKGSSLCVCSCISFPLLMLARSTLTGAASLLCFSFKRSLAGDCGKRIGQQEALWLPPQTEQSTDKLTHFWDDSDPSQHHGADRGSLSKPLLRHTQQYNRASQAVKWKKLSTLFPKWREMVPALAHRVVFRGLKNVLTCQT
jgi:hypothetical protein